MPAGRYYREDYYNLERENLWPKTWLFAGHLDELPEAGSYKLWEAVGMPVILIRGKDDEVRAFYNVCQHRGSAITTKPRGKVNKLSCQYHGWTYDLTGELVFVPGEYEFIGLNKCDKGLKPLRCETWGKLIFVNADPQAESLEQFMGPLWEALADMDFDSSELFDKLEYRIPCNWKCVQDAFQEGYHINTVHKNTVAQVLEPSVGTRSLFPNGHSHQIVRKATGEAEEEARYFDRERPEFYGPEHEITRVGQRAYAAFPNVIIPLAETQYPFIVAWPDGPDNCLVEVYYVATPGHGDPESEACKMVVQMFDVVTQEDLGILSSQQKSLRSGAISGITLGYAERMIYNSNEHLDRVLGLDKVPADLALPQVLAPFIEKKL